MYDARARASVPCTLPFTHEEIVLAVLDVGTSCIVVKPFTGYFGDGANDFLAADTIAVVYAAYLSAEQNGRQVDVPTGEYGKG